MLLSLLNSGDDENLEQETKKDPKQYPIRDPNPLEEETTHSISPTALLKGLGLCACAGLAVFAVIQCTRQSSPVKKGQKDNKPPEGVKEVAAAPLASPEGADARLNAAPPPQVVEPVEPVAPPPAPTSTPAPAPAPEPQPTPAPSQPELMPTKDETIKQLLQTVDPRATNILLELGKMYNYGEAKLNDEGDVLLSNRIKIKFGSFKDQGKDKLCIMYLNKDSEQELGDDLALDKEVSAARDCINIFIEGQSSYEPNDLNPEGLKAIQKKINATKRQNIQDALHTIGGAVEDYPFVYLFNELPEEEKRLKPEVQHRLAVARLALLVDDSAIESSIASDLHYFDNEKENTNITEALKKVVFKEDRRENILKKMAAFNNVYEDYKDNINEIGIEDVKKGTFPVYEDYKDNINEIGIEDVKKGTLPVIGSNNYKRLDQFTETHHAFYDILITATNPKMQILQSEMIASLWAMNHVGTDETGAAKAAINNKPILNYTTILYYKKINTQPTQKETRLCIIASNLDFAKMPKCHAPTLYGAGLLHGVLGGENVIRYGNSYQDPTNLMQTDYKAQANNHAVDLSGAGLVFPYLGRHTGILGLIYNNEDVKKACKELLDIGEKNTIGGSIAEDKFIQDFQKAIDAFNKKIDALTDSKPLSCDDSLTDSKLLSCDDAKAVKEVMKFGRICQLAASATTEARLNAFYSLTKQDKTVTLETACESFFNTVKQYFEDIETYHAMNFGQTFSWKRMEELLDMAVFLVHKGKDRIILSRCGLNNSQAIKHLHVLDDKPITSPLFFPDIAPKDLRYDEIGLSQAKY